MEKQYFTTIGRGHGAPCHPATREEWEEMRRQPWLADMCARIEGGESELKGKLPVWTPRCAQFRDDHRAEKDALQPLQRLMFDVDIKGQTDAILAKMTMDNEEAYIGTFHVLLVEESVRRGTHILVDLPDGMTPNEAQRQFSRLIGMEVDPAVKNAAGCIYMVPEDHTRYVSGTLQTLTPALSLYGEGAQVDTGASATRDLIRHSSHQASQSPLALNDIKDEGEPSEEALPIEGEGQGEGLLLYDNTIPYTLLVDEMVRRLGGLPRGCGNRHAFFLRLAGRLSPAMDYDEAVVYEWLKPLWEQVQYDQPKPEGELRNLIHDACQRLYLESGDLKEVLKTCRRKMGLEDDNEAKMPVSTEDSLFAFMRLPEPPALPRRLPGVLRHLTSNVPTRLRPTLSMSVFPALGAHLRGVTLRATDNVSLEPSFMHVQIARSSYGKSCINQPIECIIKKLKDRDEDIKEQRREWKKACHRNGDKRPDRPEGCKQVVTTNMTPAALTLLLYDCYKDGERSLYSCMDEVDMLNDLNKGEGNTNGRGVSKVLRLGYDHAIWGQERVGVDSVDESAPLRWFWNASGTIHRTTEFFKTSIADGTLSRLSISTIRQRGDHTYGDYDDAWQATLKPYLVRLGAATGEIRCAEAEKIARQLDQELDAYIDESVDDDDVVNGWAPRAITMALMRAVVLFIAEGYQWSREIAQFMIWSYRYDMWCKYHFFGARAEDEFGNETVQSSTKHGPASVLRFLPNPFTEEDLAEVLIEKGMENSNPKSMLANWRSRKKIAKDKETGAYIHL